MIKGTSNYEQEIYNFLKNYTTIETNNRSAIAPKEIDLLLPDKKIGIEFIHNSLPNSWYFLPAEVIRYHRFALRKPATSTLTERKLRESQGHLRIYDFRSSKWVWTK